MARSFSEYGTLVTPTWMTMDRHSWVGTHNEMNFSSPNNTLKNPISHGFVRQNDATEELDNGNETPTGGQTISFCKQEDLPSIEVWPGNSPSMINSRRCWGQRFRTDLT
jgi:hypothetical protein